jgi:hypothetical protein
VILGVLEMGTNVFEETLLLIPSVEEADLDPEVGSNKLCPKCWYSSVSPVSAYRACGFVAFR